MKLVLGILVLILSHIESLKLPVNSIEGGNTFEGILNEDFPEQFEVKGLPIQQKVYSGYFQVHESGSSLYYQLFSPSEDSLSNPEIPLLLWLNGGPGSTSQLGNFMELGPLELIMRDGKVIPQRRDITWCDEYHVIFVDSPVGIGYSVALNNYSVNTTEQYAQDLYEFFQQFFKKYQNLKKNPFYLTGESYAGHYIPALADIILKEQSQEKMLNIKGIAIGDGLVDFSAQGSPYAQYAYAAGISTPKNYKEDIKLAKQLEFNARTHNYTPVIDQAQQLAENIVKRAGNVDIDNFRKYESTEPTPDLLTLYLNSTETKKQFGIPKSINFVVSSSTIFKDFTIDIALSFTNKFQSIISKIPVLIYVGQDDINVSTIGCWEWILQLPDYYFPYNKHVKYQVKQNWKIKNSPQIAGTVKISNNFYFAIVYQGGHLTPNDAPLSSRDMIKRFINNEKDWTQ